MNMIVPAPISATPNGTTRAQLRIVIVGHVDHGKSTLVGRLLHELERTKVPERAGRALDHETEDAFERLRVAGYL